MQVSVKNNKDKAVEVDFLMSDFTHFDNDGNAVMVDVGDKKKTKRQAEAVGSISMSGECFKMICQGTVKKGDVLSIARIAGIMAVKQTGTLIPLCHNISVDSASINFKLNDNDNTISASCIVKTTGCTGVEMEALTGVSIALLTIYDMCKSIDRCMKINNVYLVKKSGGKSEIH